MKRYADHFKVLELREVLARESVKAAIVRRHALTPMPRLRILCGTAAGLPFDHLMTDVISGCLPLERICYGNCTAAEHWITQGYDFGKRSINSFDPVLFRESVAKLPKELRWVRQGWASDCSLCKEGWSLVAHASRILQEYDIFMLLITKAWTSPTPALLLELAQANVEVRISLSAFDTRSELANRTALLCRYREVGGKAVPYLMSARFKHPELAHNQDAIVKWIIEGDYISAEHPLRISADNSAMSLLDDGGFWHPKFPEQYWFGRIYDHIPNFVLPPPTCLLPAYRLSARYRSELSPASLQLDRPLPTYEELRRGMPSPPNTFKHATYHLKPQADVCSTETRTAETDS